VNLPLRLLGDLRAHRQEHARLDAGERRGHLEVLGGDVEVQHLHRVDVLEVLLGDEPDGDVDDVELVLADQVQEQLERPREPGQLDLVGHVDRRGDVEPRGLVAPVEPVVVAVGGPLHQPCTINQSQSVGKPKAPNAPIIR
jgi:hypothetical protein